VNKVINLRVPLNVEKFLSDWWHLMKDSAPLVSYIVGIIFTYICLQTSELNGILNFVKKINFLIEKTRVAFCSCLYV
jgi:hypothetical protein